MDKRTEFGGDDLGTIYKIFYGYTLSEVITERINHINNVYGQKEFSEKYPYTFIKIRRTWWGKVRSIIVYHSCDKLESEPMYQVLQF
jgi:hypothetical protein